MSSELFAPVTADAVEEIMMPGESSDVVDDAEVLAPANPARRIEFWGLGTKEAIITVLNHGDTKERLEQAVMTRQKHPRNNELLKLNEQGDLNVIHLRFESWTSLQALITELRGHKVEISKMTFAYHGTSEA